MAQLTGVNFVFTINSAAVDHLIRNCYFAIGDQDFDQKISKQRGLINH